MHGKFIVFEGLDGSGKSTQAELLKESFEEQGLKVFLTKECTDGPIGTLLRKEYLSGHRKINEAVINILMAADRIEHVDEINQHLEAGDIVISDRYVLSGFAYNTYMDPTFDRLTDTYNMNRLAITKCQPDLTLFLDVDPTICIDRINSRPGNHEVYETLDKLERIRKAYFKTFDFFNCGYFYDDDRDKNVRINMHVKTITCNDMNPDKIRYIIWRIARNILNNHG